MGYSTDFKEKVMHIMARDKMTVRQAAVHFDVCTQTIQNWKKSTVAKPIPGRQVKISFEQIKTDVQMHPDDYIKERAERFGVSTHAVFRALHAAGLSRKKRRSTTPKPIQ